MVIDRIGLSDADDSLCQQRREVGEARSIEGHCRQFAAVAKTSRHEIPTRQSSAIRQTSTNQECQPFHRVDDMRRIPATIGTQDGRQRAARRGVALHHEIGRAVECEAVKCEADPNRESLSQLQHAADPRSDSGILLVDQMQLQSLRDRGIVHRCQHGDDA